VVAKVVAIDVPKLFSPISELYTNIDEGKLTDLVKTLRKRIDELF